MRFHVNGDGAENASAIPGSADQRVALIENTRFFEPIFFVARLSLTALPEWRTSQLRM